MATFILMFAVPGLLLGSSDFPGHAIFDIASWIIGIPGLLLSYWVAITYIPTLRKNLRDGRSERAAAKTAAP
jgi:cardiolipin synthase